MVSRRIGDLTFEDASHLQRGAVLLWPLGSLEQHGPHLPLDTDAVLAQALAERIVERHGDRFDLWLLPALPFGLSREHAWAPGTMSLSVSGMAALLRELCAEIVRSLPARNLMIVNGHGGNSGFLEAMIRELHGDFGLNVCALHSGALMSPVPETGLPEIHAGADETSLMLALAPQLVRLDRMVRLPGSPDEQAVRTTILDAGVSWPWSSDDARIADRGIIGDVRGASAERGEAIAERIVATAAAVLQRLLDGAAEVRGGRPFA